MTAIHAVLGNAEAAIAADLIARSFYDLEQSCDLVPDPDRRLSVLRSYFYIHTQHAARGAGKVLATVDGHGVAVWFDRTGKASEPANYAERLAEAVGEYLPRFQRLDHWLEELHPEDPHWHLAFLAVDPDYQDKGVGSALLNYFHAYLDGIGVAAYLEATSADNQRLYKRHDYLMMRPSLIELPGAAPFTRLWRPARGDLR